MSDMLVFTSVCCGFALALAIASLCRFIAQFDENDTIGMRNLELGIAYIVVFVVLWITAAWFYTH